MNYFKTEYWPLDRLKPDPKNAMTHPDEQVAELASLIDQFGFLQPILVDGAGMIIAGHGRLLAAYKLHLTEVPVIVCGHLSEVQKRTLALADNKVTRKGEWHSTNLRESLAELARLSPGIPVVGWSPGELSAILSTPVQVPDLSISVAASKPKPEKREADHKTQTKNVAESTKAEAPPEPKSKCPSCGHEYLVCQN